jgi:hypothetical protein
VNRLCFVARRGRSNGLWTQWEMEARCDALRSFGYLNLSYQNHCTRRHSSSFYIHNELQQGNHQFVALVGSGHRSRSLNRMPRSTPLFCM